jgi:purine-binding chemotaxis protein CheW
MLRDGASRLLVFRLGTELFGVDLAAVEQVVDAPEAKPIPDSPPSVRGLTSLQGELVTLYDLQHLLNVRPRAIHAALVFRRGDRRLAVAVEDVFDTMTIEEGMLRKAPGAGVKDDVLVGVVRRGRHLVGVLDPVLLVDALAAPSEVAGIAVNGRNAT